MTMNFNTEDKLEYQFHPFSGGIIRFKVRAEHDAHLALTTGPSEANPIVEVFLGGWKNTKSVIRKNRNKPDVVEVDTPGILNAGEFRGFWIRWTHDGIITVGREDEAAAFMSWEDPDRVPFQYVGVCTGWGATGCWQIEGGHEVKTSDCLEYNFMPMIHGGLTVEFKGPSNCHIGLMSVRGEERPLTEIILGGWENKASVIRVNRQSPDKVRVDTPNLLSSNHFTKFFIRWQNGALWVRKDHEQGPIVIEGKDCVNFQVKHVAFRSGWGARGQWRVNLHDHSIMPVKDGASLDIRKSPGWMDVPTPPPRREGPAAGFGPMAGRGGGGGGGACAGSACWVPGSNGSIPPGAIVGGQDGETIYIARARFNGALIPGKLVPSHQVCYVPWSGTENAVSEYEVLCGSGGSWVPTAGDSIPGSAVPGGETEDGEPLFIGRASHEGTLTVGKVQPSHGCVYIPYGGSELRYQEYEIFIQ